MSEQTLEIFNEQKIAAYDPFRSQLAELKAGNEKVVFDYESEKGNKEARSHIYKLRQTKSAVDRVRKDQKDASLQYGRRVDAQAKEIITEIEEMIEVHEAPIKAIEQREKDRIAGHQANMDRIQQYADMDLSSYDAERLEGLLRPIDEMEPDESYEEFTAPALSIWKQAREKAINALAARQKYEAEQAELERLRAEQAERERQEREAKIAQEAAEKARIEAETKAQAERDAAAKREAEAEAKAALAEKARIAAEAKAKQDAIDAEERQKAAVKAAEDRAKAEAEAAKQREIDEAAKREQNKKHQAKINNEAVADLVAGGIAEDIAKQVVTLIAQRKIRNMQVNY